MLHIIYICIVKGRYIEIGIMMSKQDYIKIGDGICDFDWNWALTVHDTKLYVLPQSDDSESLAISFNWNGKSMIYGDVHTSTRYSSWHHLEKTINSLRP